MASQGWVEQGLAVAMIATAGYCATCLMLPKLRRTTLHHDADLVHVVMAVAMAAMLLGVARPVWAGSLVFAFALPACWFAIRAFRELRRPTAAWFDGTGRALGHVQLSVAGVAMIFMSGAMPGFGSASTPGDSAAVTTTPHGHAAGHSTVVTGGSGASSGSVGVDFALAGAVIFTALAAFAFVSIGQLAASAEHSSSPVRRRLWPYRLTVCCQLAMTATMAHMLAAMV